MKAIQYFTDEYLEQCQKMTLDQRLKFLEDFRQLQRRRSPSKLISLKVPEDLLKAFREKCQRHDKKYQTQIKELMMRWLEEL